MWSAHIARGVGDYHPRALQPSPRRRLAPDLRDQRRDRPLPECFRVDRTALREGACTQRNGADGSNDLVRHSHLLSPCFVLAGFRISLVVVVLSASSGTTTR